MQLYERIMQGKKTTYREHIPKKIEMPEIEQNQVTTLLYALSISMLMSVREQLPAHALVARKVKAVEDAIVSLSAITAVPMDEDLVTVGVQAWNGAIHSMQAGLSGGAHA